MPHKYIIIMNKNIIQNTMNSDYEVRLATLEAMGGDTTKHYDSVYEIDLAILKSIEEGGGCVSQEYVDQQDEAVKDWVSASSYITAAALPDMNSYVSKNELSAQSYVTANTLENSEFVLSKAINDLELNKVSYTDLSAMSYATTTYVNTYFGKIVTLTQAEYDALVTKDPMTIYIISDAQ